MVRCAVLPLRFDIILEVCIVFIQTCARRKTIVHTSEPIGVALLVFIVRLKEAGEWLLAHLLFPRLKTTTLHTAAATHSLWNVHGVPCTVACGLRYQLPPNQLQDFRGQIYNLLCVAIAKVTLISVCANGIVYVTLGSVGANRTSFVALGEHQEHNKCPHVLWRRPPLQDKIEPVAHLRPQLAGGTVCVWSLSQTRRRLSQRLP
mmetsp:Transcript_46484/g.55906  ORF Transcript_46484/g.55906 Transcript_46484/m.55906 type:complete len:204 (+) Transcript_46484:604-1215(+)